MYFSSSPWPLVGAVLFGEHRRGPAQRVCSSCVATLPVYTPRRMAWLCEKPHRGTRRDVRYAGLSCMSHCTCMLQTAAPSMQLEALAPRHLLDQVDLIVSLFPLGTSVK